MRWALPLSVLLVGRLVHVVLDLILLVDVVDAGPLH